MRKIRTAFDQLIFDAGEVLKNKLLRANNTVLWYRIYWRRIYKELLNSGVTEFTSNIGRQYLLSKFGEDDFASLSKKDKDLIKIVNVLCEFYDTGTLTSYKERITLDGPIGDQMKQFIAYQVSLRLKPSTMRERELYLSRFLFYLKDKGIASLDEVDKFIILGACRTYQFHDKYYL